MNEIKSYAADIDKEYEEYFLIEEKGDEYTGSKITINGLNIDLI